jgi:hypothetical protein
VLHLLLASAKDGRPALPEGLPLEALRNAPPPNDRTNLETRANFAVDPNDLRRQRWDVIVPAGPRGNALLQAIRPLVELREEEQKAKIKTYRLPPDLDSMMSFQWLSKVYNAEPTATRPRYLLILGDLDEVSLELQGVLSNVAFVGRLHTGESNDERRLAGFEGYARKVVRWAEAERQSPRMLFWGADDGTKAMRAAEEGVLQPCVKALHRMWTTEEIQVQAVERIRLPKRSAQHLVTALAADRSVLFSASHGSGEGPGWTPTDQRALQGALVLGDGVQLTARDVRNGKVLPGGVWVALACFGACTPSKSVYHAWLEGMTDADGKLKAPRVLDSLPADGKGFVSALPQALLENPDGPLAFIGHADLAWTYLFGDVDGPWRPERVTEPLRQLVDGCRVGVALDEILRRYRSANDELLEGYQAEEDARALKQDHAVDQDARAQTWMLRNDLRGYVLLGDPAAKLAGP